MDSAVRKAARRVRQLGEADFADSFGGLLVDQGRNELTVYRRPSEAFDAVLRETAAGVRLVLRDAPHSLRDLREVQRRVEQDTPEWRRAGIEITRVGVTAAARGVSIGVAVLNDATRAALTDRYGADRIMIEQSGPAIPL
jgi:hypothetical protein